MSARVVVTAGAALVAGLSLGCVEELRLFDVELQVRVADGVDDDVFLTNGAPDVDDDLGLSFNYFPDVGDENGGDPRVGEGLPFDPAATTSRFELLAFLDGVPAARGATGVLPLPKDPGAILPVPLLLATVDVVGALDPLPPAIGADACVSADQQGRVFVAGGNASNQTGYVLDDSFAVSPLSGVAFAQAQRPGCVGFDGAVVVVGGCEAGALAEVHEISADEDRVRLSGLPAEPCGAFAANSLQDYWVFATNRVDLLDSNGGSLGSTGGVNVVDVEAIVGGDALVLTDDDTLFLYRRSNVAAPVNLGSAQAIGRRFDDVVALSTADELLLIKDGGAGVIRTGVGAGVVTSFTVLSDDAVVVIEGNNLVLRPAEGPTRTFPLPRARTHVSAIPGDTLILAGGAGEGLDALSLR